MLTALGGAPFALLQTGGYGFAPLAHGAVIAPSTVTIVSTIGAALFLRERLEPQSLVGAAIVLGGHRPDRLGRARCSLPANAHGWAIFSSSPRASCGHASRSCCAIGGVHGAARHRRGLRPVLPGDDAGVPRLGGPGASRGVAARHVAFQGMIQGGLQGVITMVAYGQAVVLLG